MTTEIAKLAAEFVWWAAVFSGLAFLLVGARHWIDDAIARRRSRREALTGGTET